ncbi:hypothetical protein OG21DRAFT_1503957 [Imleria badia]|nr:hypothetical protein OG21DRAFT_1503957 [Imleria badia]
MQGRRRVSDATRKIVECFDNFGPDMRTVVKPTNLKGALHVVKQVITPIVRGKQGRTCRTACHAMTNYFGAGAVQAINVRP